MTFSVTPDDFHKTCIGLTFPKYLASERIRLKIDLESNFVALAATCLLLYIPREI